MEISASAAPLADRPPHVLLTKHLSYVEPDGAPLDAAMIDVRSGGDPH